MAVAPRQSGPARGGRHRRKGARSLRAPRCAACSIPMFSSSAPDTAWLDGVVALHDKGFVLTGAVAGAGTPCATSRAGVGAVGDVRLGPVRRVASSVGEGSVVNSHVWAHVIGSTPLIAAGGKRRLTPG